MTRNQEKLIKQKIDKWLESKGGTVEDRERKSAAWLRYFDMLKTPVVQLAACAWLCSGAVILPEDLPKVEQAVKVAQVNKVDPLLYRRPMDLIDAFGPVEMKVPPIDPDSVDTLHLVRKFDTGLSIYDVDESQESRENMRKIINTHFGKESNPWCLLQGDGDGTLTEKSAEYWNHYSAYPKQVAFVDSKLAAFSANDYDFDRVWWNRKDERSFMVSLPGKIPGDPLGRVANKHYSPRTGGVLGYTDIERRVDMFRVECYESVGSVVPEKVRCDVEPESRKDLKGEVRIPEGVTEIGLCAFQSCEFITKVNIPKGVTRILPAAFLGCKSLSEICIPESVTEIGYCVFEDCVSLTKAYIPEGVTKIGLWAFKDCKSLTEVRIPDSVKKIGDDTFWGCRSLKSVVIPKLLNICLPPGAWEVVHRPEAFPERTVSRLTEFGLSPEDIEVLRSDCRFEAATPAGKVQMIYRKGEILVGDRKEQLGQALWQIKKDPGYLGTLVKPEKKTENQEEAGPADKGGKRPGRT